jgi:alpha-D-ribose 1-methylphosphonate 5-triphosphate diphosphatase
MTTLTLSNAKIITADEIVTGSLKAQDGVIADMDHSNASGAIDFEGDYLVPGLVELHTDHLESHYNPRPNVYWSPMAALQAHDAQVASSGITTVFDAVRIGSDAEASFNLGEHVSILMGAIEEARRDARLRADHFVHLRCELASSDALEHFEEYHDSDAVRLASLMDHTPGQRQFVTLDLYYAYYQGKTGRSDEEMHRFIQARMADQEKYYARNRDGIVAISHDVGLALASHDDATEEHVEEAKANGVRISEFPTTEAAARAAREAGLSILMGAPNVVRGKSHSGNISANELAHLGLLDVLSSDYVPFSLMQAAFAMPDSVDSITLPEAVAKVSKNPANAAGLDDRGEIALGKQADFSRVHMHNGVPIVKAVWRQGERVA